MAILHMHPGCPAIKSLLLPSNSTISPRNIPKTAKNGCNVRCSCQKSPKPETARILGYVAQNCWEAAMWLWSFICFVCTTILICHCMHVSIRLDRLVGTELGDS